MIQRAPSSCFGAVSNIGSHGRARLILTHRPVVHIFCRAYASSPPEKSEEFRPEKAAILAVQHRKAADPINPPRSTLPAALNLPKDNTGNVLLRWFRIGRAYGGFYWVGIKAVWFNYQAVEKLREDLKTSAGSGGDGSLKNGKKSLATRAEYQLMQRNTHDIEKLPFFAVLVVVLGEWLMFVVPFMPGVVPGTCKFPTQVRQMREKAEERRRISFRQGISEPTDDQIPNPSELASNGTATQKWPMTQPSFAAEMISRLRDDQLHHLSSTLNVHSRLWDRIHQRPPSFLLRRGVSKRLAYITIDDLLLYQHSGKTTLSVDELNIACEERGLDVSGRAEYTLRSELASWVARQTEDKGRGSALLAMLFRRSATRERVQFNV